MISTIASQANVLSRGGRQHSTPQQGASTGDAFAGSTWVNPLSSLATLRAVTHDGGSTSKADASGFVGSNFLRASLLQQDGQVGVSGAIGGAGIELNCQVGAGSTSINGLLTQGAGLCNVNVTVQGTDDGKRLFSGLVGDGLVMVTETPNEHGATLVGDIGDTSMSLTRIDEKNRTLFQGTVTSGDNSCDVNVTVSAQGATMPPCDALVPLFSFV